MNGFQDKVGFVWSIAELLRGDFKQSEYGKVILPLVVLRRLDCVLEPTKQKVLDKAKTIPKNADEAIRDVLLCQAAGHKFYNLSRFTLTTLLRDQEHLSANVNNFINGFSSSAREIFIDKFKFGDQIDRLDESNLLFLVLSRFAQIDLHPQAVDNVSMGYIFEELIRRFSEQSNETAGEHFTPREVIRLMVNLLFMGDDDALRKKGVIRTLYDPASGTGGMLTVAEEYLRELNPSATLKVYGQEINPESYAICKSDMLIKGQEQDASNIKFGNSFTQDGLKDEKFDYFLSNPPFGVDWKKYEDEIRQEADTLGKSGRFGAGLPRVSDGSLLFLQHMLSKFKRNGSGSRLAIVLNGSPLFTGSAGSGESEIRRWIIENDWLEAIVALPEQLFYNTGITTYVWIVTNRKTPQRQGKIQLVNAMSFFQKMRKSLGNKRNEISPEQIEQITRLYGEFAENDFVKMFDNEDFGYWQVAVERPLRLNFAATHERVERLKSSSAFASLDDPKKRKGKSDGKDLQPKLLAAVASLAGAGVFKNRDQFAAKLKDALASHRVTLSPQVFKMVLSSLSDRDETADLCTDSKGQHECDPDLRDFENVPLTEHISDYFKREVLPHVPDAWIDETKTKKGYEIPVTRQFYQYRPLRPLAEIEREIETLEVEIQAMLKGVMA